MVTLANGPCGSARGNTLRPARSRTQALADRHWLRRPWSRVGPARTADRRRLLVRSVFDWGVAHAAHRGSGYTRTTLAFSSAPTRRLRGERSWRRDTVPATASGSRLPPRAHALGTGACAHQDSATTKWQSQDVSMYTLYPSQVSVRAISKCPGRDTASTGTQVDAPPSTVMRCT